jgi:glucose/arabinose dehydrogenase
MLRRAFLLTPLAGVAASLIAGWPAESLAQPRTSPLDDGPWLFDTYEEGTRIRVSVMARPLSHPWSLVFLPDGGILITERDGRLRLVRDGALLPEPVAEMPEVSRAPLAGLMDLALHPRFDENQLVYFTYSKPIEDSVATILGRGRWTGERLIDIEDVFMADDFGERRAGAARILFDSDTTLFMSNGGTGQVGDTRSPSTVLSKETWLVMSRNTSRVGLAAFMSGT